MKKNTMTLKNISTTVCAALFAVAVIGCSNMINDFKQSSTSAATYTLTFNANGGTGTMAAQTFASGTAQALTANTFTRTGYTFAGWAAASDASSVLYTDGQSVTITADTTLYAVWQAGTASSYTVTFNVNGGTGTMANETFSSGIAKALTANTFTRTGYDFIGWGTSSDATTATYTDGQSITVTADTTLYAVWQTLYYWYTKDTSASTFTISVVHQLWEFANLVNGTDTANSGQTGPVTFSGKTVQLAADMDLSAICSDSLGSWTPIGISYSNSFQGTFDGNSKTVSNLYINTTSGYGGLFGNVVSATLKNFTVSGSVTNSPSCSYTGGITGYACYSRIADCTSSVAVTASDTSYTGTGGIVGFCEGLCYVVGCTNSGTVTGSHYTGGIIGHVRNPNGNTDVYYITGCTNTGAVTSSSQCAGGIIGMAQCESNTTTNIFGNCNSGSITAQNTSNGYAGGIAGYVYGSSTKNIYICDNTGSITGGTYAGGILGYVSDNTLTSKYCYSWRTDTPTSTQSGILGAKEGSSNFSCSNNYYNKTGTITTGIGGATDVSGQTDALSDIAALNTDVAGKTTEDAGDTSAYHYKFVAGSNTATDLPTIAAY